MIYCKTKMKEMPQSCPLCQYGKKYGAVGDVECKKLAEYFTNNPMPPYKDRPDECPLIEVPSSAAPVTRLHLSCPNCGNTGWLWRQEEASFECAACGEISNPEDMSATEDNATEATLLALTGLLQENAHNLDDDTDEYAKGYHDALVDVMKALGFPCSEPLFD